MMEKMALIMNGRRWVGPADYFGDAFITKTGGLRIPFTIADNTLQNVCIDFERVMGLTGGETHMRVFRANCAQNEKHMERLEALLSRNRNWKRIAFIMAENPASVLSLQKTSQ